MDKLKPCPFCGEEVYMEALPLWNGSHGYYGCFEYVIKCKKCGGATNLNGNDTIYHTSEVAKKNAIESWNRRANNG